MTSLPPVKAFDWANLGLRVVSATVLIPAVVLAIWTGGWLFLLMIAVAVALLAAFALQLALRVENAGGSGLSGTMVRAASIEGAVQRVNLVSKETAPA